MAKEGFEYRPIDHSGFGPAVGSEHQEEVDTDSDGFIEQYGYGITDWPGAESLEDQVPEEFVNPNQEYLNSLTESERQAFQQALNGPMPSDEELATLEE
ncbi:MAG: hypothetical protein QM606_07310, partial [Leucobacter sp.]